MLALDNLGKVYPNGVNALEGFSARIKPGEIQVAASTAPGGAFAAGTSRLSIH